MSEPYIRSTDGVLYTFTRAELAAHDAKVTEALRGEVARWKRVAESNRSTAQDYADEVVAAHAARDDLRARAEAAEAKIAAVEGLRDALWTESQQDSTIIHHAGIMQGIGDQITAALRDEPRP